MKNLWAKTTAYKIVFIFFCYLAGKPHCFSQGSCGSPDGAFFVTPGNPANYTVANSGGWCYNNLTAGQTYCWTYVYPAAGDFFIKIIRNGTCGNCDGSASICLSPGCMAGPFSFAVSCANTQYTPACGIQQAGGIEIGTSSTPAQVCGNTFTWCLTVPAGCNTMDVCPIVSSGCTVILPVELISFSAECKKGMVDISWDVASEVNNDYFTVERSVDGTHYSAIGKVKGAGTIATPQHYTFTDNPETFSASHESIYYRLSQTDFDGTNKTFSPVAVKADCGKDLFIYPTLSEGEIFILTSHEYPSADVSVYDLLGRTVYAEKISEKFDAHRIDLHSIAKGVYSVVVSTANDQIVQKIVLR